MFEWNDGTALYHYGIPGMKWGVMNGPPYPLGIRQRSAKEKREEYQDKNYEKSQSDPEVTKRKLRKAIIIGASVAGAALLAYGAYKVYTNYNATAVIDPTTGLPLIQGTRSEKEIIKHLNPGRIETPFGSMDAIRGSSANCMLNTTAADLQMRGYDVYPGLSTNGFPTSDIANWYTHQDGTSIIGEKVKFAGFEINKVSRWADDAGINTTSAGINNFKELERSILQKFPEGAHGNFMFNYQDWLGAGAGHSVQWQIKNGKVYINDGQIGKYGSKLLNYCRFNFVDIDDLDVVRTDHLKPNIEYMLEKGLIRTDNNTKFIVDNLPSVPKNIFTDSDSLTTLFYSTVIPVGLALDTKLVLANKKQEKTNDTSRKDNSQSGKNTRRKAPRANR